ncbi:hypothetical protein LJ739_06850 [Aestuariibacter halophilus]|uniref:Uncharacterized protein n=1 Tax=Fluctibacter halophilus TaxID=226011 RepID=A0ABS8G605_9ALTE|nr:hypothetical protein [Aestuariibacter halophilus]MCC2615955.1 hypothetical protein [Aestuariibacter halophilus]
MSQVALLDDYREKRVNQGYILNYREMLQQEWFTDPVKCPVFEYLLKQAQHSEFHTTVHGQPVTLNPGQLYVTHEGLAKATSVYTLYSDFVRSKDPVSASKKAVQRALDFFVQDGAIKYQVIGKGKRAFTIITLVNWVKFQSGHVPKAVPKAVPKETQSQQGLQADSVPNPVPNSVPKNKECINNKEANSASRQLPDDLLSQIRAKREECFGIWWDVWRDGKKSVGAGYGAKTKDGEQPFKKYFPDKLIAKQGIDWFIDDINAMCAFTDTVFEDLRTNGSNSRYFNYRCMFPGTFFAKSEWRDAE